MGPGKVDRRGQVAVLLQPEENVVWMWLCDSSAEEQPEEGQSVPLGDKRGAGHHIDSGSGRLLWEKPMFRHVIIAF